MTEPTSQLEDWIPAYPESSDPDIAFLLTSKKEFDELRSRVQEPIPRRGQLYRHQKAFVRHMLQYDRAFNFSQAGTGKSCQFIGLVELLKHRRNVIQRVYVLQKGPSTLNDFKFQITCRCTAEGTYDTSMVQKANTEASRKGNATREIKKWYTVTTYRSLAKDIQARFFDAKTQRWDDDGIRREYSGSAFLLDEGHNLRNDSIITDAEVERIYQVLRRAYPQFDRSKIAITTITAYRRLAKDIEARFYDTRTQQWDDIGIRRTFTGAAPVLDEGVILTGDGTSSQAELDGIYAVLHRVFHLVERSKIVVSTATPMINDVNELPRLANLLLPLNHQLPETWDYSMITLEQLEPYFRGMVTFVRNLDTGAIPVFRGIVPTVVGSQPPAPLTHTIAIPSARFRPGPIDAKRSQPLPDVKNGTLEVKRIASQTIVYPSKMGDIQDRTYQQAKENQGQFYDAQRQASSFVFPDGSIGGTYSKMQREYNDAHVAIGWQPLVLDQSGLGKYVYSDRNIRYVATKELEPWLRLNRNPQPNAPDLRRLSGKFAAVLEIETKEAGCAFCFSDFLSGGGAILLGLCFEANGFENYDESTSAFGSIGLGPTSICAGAAGTRRIKPNITKKPRYALLTGETSDSKMQSLLELFNSEENVNGEYIKVIIGSQVTRDGINLFNVRRGHLMTAGWHPSGIYQALSRFIRAVSHDNLLTYLRKQAVAEGRDPMAVTIEVSIYKHAAMDHNGDSVDVMLYLMAEDKDLYIQRVMRMLKQIAWDCQLNYNRNVRTFATDLRRIDPKFVPTAADVKKYDVDYSATCDYDICAYQCVGPLVKTADGYDDKDLVDYSTYDILYSDEVIDAIISNLTQILRSRGNITFPELMELWVTSGVYRQKFIYMAVDRILTEKKQVLDRFGFGCYIQTDGFNIFTQREFPTDALNTRSELSLYSECVVGILTTSFERLVAERSSVAQAALIEQLASIKDPNGEKERLQFNTLLQQLSNESQVKLLETSIIKLLEKDQTPLYLAVYKRLGSYVFVAREPVEDIRASREAMAAKPEAGRTPGKMIKPKITFKGEPGPDERNASGQPYEIIYIHTLYSAAGGNTSYNVTSRFTKAGDRICILKLSERKPPQWRNATPYEFFAYSNIVQAQLRKRMEPYEKFEVYGTIYYDHKFRIRDKRTEKRATSGDDNRLWHRGEICGTRAKPELLSYLMENDMLLPPEVAATPETTDSRPEMIAYLVSKKYSQDPSIVAKLSDPQLRYLIRWYQTPIASRNYMCSVLQAHFAATGRLLMI